MDISTLQVILPYNRLPYKRFLVYMRTSYLDVSIEGEEEEDGGEASPGGSRSEDDESDRQPTFEKSIGRRQNTQVCARNY